MFQVRHGSHGHLEDIRFVACNAVTFDNFGDVRYRFTQPGGLLAVGRQVDESQDGQSHFCQVNLGVITLNDPGVLQAAYPLCDGWSGQPNHFPDLAEG